MIRNAAPAQSGLIAALRKRLIEDIILNGGDFMVRSMKLKARWMADQKLGITERENRLLFQEHRTANKPLLCKQ